MIIGPFNMQKTVFYDWDDTVAGVLLTPCCVLDKRYYINFFVAANLIHPELSPYLDEWKEERDAKRARAKADWPRRRIFPEETFYFTADADGRPELRHSLRYLPEGYVPNTGASAYPFRPGKEAADGGTA